MKAALALCALAATSMAQDANPPADSAVVSVTADSFKAEVLDYEGLVIVEYYAPWCGHCKSLAPEYAKAADTLKGKPVKFAAVDATEHGSVSEMFEVSGFPTIVYHMPGKKEDEEGILYESYQGGRQADHFVDFVGEELLKVGIDIAEIKEITSEADMEECINAKKYCAVMILPHVVETGAEGRNAMIETIKETQKLNGKASPTTFVWMQGGSQEAFESAFNVGGYPTMTVVNHARTRFAHHIGAFKPEAMAKTLRSILTGRITPSDYKTFPKMVTTEPWDGKDYVYPEEEDYEL